MIKNICQSFLIIFRLLIKQLVTYFHETISFLGHSKTNPMKHYVVQIYTCNSSWN